ncbi:hypothetical protein [Chitinophaga barathri]|uniref:Uncharacterized protein n=1 Tax=Chitinophaga barathri TaxID=1647451 RepID=A0A3N4N4W5_9BACT|nr:hypothetical protein [Chitinophaga barathri]RPD42663.1 hypothetical protein EG028_05720 [Chitinophaga barathri]
MTETYTYEVPKEFPPEAIALVVLYVIVALLIVRVLLRHKETNQSLYEEGMLKALRKQTNTVTKVRELTVLLCVEYNPENYAYLKKRLTDPEETEEGEYTFTVTKSAYNLFLCEFFDQHGQYCRVLVSEHYESNFRPKLLDLFRYGPQVPFSVKVGSDRSLN